MNRFSDRIRNYFKNRKLGLKEISRERLPWGKLAGVILGLFSGLRIFGFVFGLLLGHFIDVLIQEKRLRRDTARLFTSSTESTDCPGSASGTMLDSRSKTIASVAGLSLTVAKSGGLAADFWLVRVIALLEKSLCLSPKEYDFINQLAIDFLGAGSPDTEGIVLICRQAFRDPDNKLGPKLLLEILFDSAAISGSMAGDRKILIREISKSLKIPDEIFRMVRDRKVPEQRNAYLLLGVTPETPNAEIRRIYRSLAAQFHPDSLKPLSQEQRFQAEEAFLKIKAAYDSVIQDR